MIFRLNTLPHRDGSLPRRHESLGTRFYLIETDPYNVGTNIYLDYIGKVLHAVQASNFLKNRCNDPCLDSCAQDFTSWAHIFTSIFEVKSSWPGILGKDFTSKIDVKIRAWNFEPKTILTSYTQIFTSILRYIFVPKKSMHLTLPQRSM